MQTFIQFIKQNQPEGLTALAPSTRDRDRITEERIERIRMTKLIESVLKDLLERSNVNG